MLRSLCCPLVHSLFGSVRGVLVRAFSPREPLFPFLLLGGGLRSAASVSNDHAVSVRILASYSMPFLRIVWGRHRAVVSLVGGAVFSWGSGDVGVRCCRLSLFRVGLVGGSRSVCGLVCSGCGVLLSLLRGACQLRPSAWGFGALCGVSVSYSIGSVSVTRVRLWLLGAVSEVLLGCVWCHLLLFPPVSLAFRAPLPSPTRDVIQSFS